MTASATEREGGAMAGTWMTEEMREKVCERMDDTLTMLRHAIGQRDGHQMIVCTGVLIELREFLRPLGTDKDGGER